MISEEMISPATRDDQATGECRAVAPVPILWALVLPLYPSQTSLRERCAPRRSR